MACPPVLLRSAWDGNYQVFTRSYGVSRTCGPDQAACGRNRETEHLKEDKHIPFIKPFCINFLQLPELRPILNS